MDNPSTNGWWLGVALWLRKRPYEPHHHLNLFPPARTFVHLPIMSPIMTPSIMGYNPASSHSLWTTCWMGYLHQVHVIMGHKSATPFWTICWMGSLHQLDFVMRYKSANRSEQYWMGSLHQLDSVMWYKSATHSEQYVEQFFFFLHHKGPRWTNVRVAANMFKPHRENTGSCFNTSISSGARHARHGSRHQNVQLGGVPHLLRMPLGCNLGSFDWESTMTGV